MYNSLDIVSRRIFQGAFFALALFVPFSIAGENIAIGFVALAWLLSSVAARIAPPGARAQRPSILHDPMLLASILLVVSAVPSVLISEDRQRAVHDWQSYWQLLIYFGVAAHLVAVGMRETVVRALAVSSILSCLVAFVQRAGGMDAGFVHIGGQYRVSSTLYTMTFSGILVQLVVFYAAAFPVRGLQMRERALYMVAIACQFTALMFTMTRGAWIAAVAGIVALCLLVRSRVLLAAGGVLVVLLVAFSFLHAHEQGRTLSITALFGSTPDRNVHTRLVLWEVAWDLFREHPILGVGMGDYSAQATLLAADRNVRTVTDAHSIPLHILATRGIVGFLPFLYYWFVVFRVLRQVLRGAERGSRARAYALGMISVVVAVLVAALTENNIDDEEVFAAFMFLLAVARSEAYRPRGVNASAAPEPAG